MSETTNLNSELLSADARGRKHIPFAVFAVILIHIVLFLFLLIAAGCRAKARAKRNAQPAPEMLALQPKPAPSPAILPASPATNAIPTVVTPAAIQPVVVTEPPAEKRPVQPAIRKAAQKSAPAQRPTAASTPKARIYVVKAGDTVEKIAKMHRTSVQAIKTENKLKDHTLKPGQQLRVGTQAPKPSNEV